jgi:hypothetical protein
MDISLNSLVGVPSSQAHVSNWGLNPTVLAVVILVVVVYVALFSSIGSGLASVPGEGGQPGPNGGLSYLEVFLWGLFVLLILLNGMAYMFNMDVTATLRGLFSSSPEVDMVVRQDGSVPFEAPETTVPELRFKKQVFHVPGNEYTYEDARAICQAYGGGLASYDQIEAAYAGGADWCSYGWSDAQLALYPTQKERWATLQGIPGHKHDCGRPGINGGYIANPNVRFGVNCYGYKPKITQQEAEEMDSTPLYPPTRRELQFEKLVRKWRDRLSEILVSPFNHDNWSMPTAGAGTTNSNR